MLRISTTPRESAAGPGTPGETALAQPRAAVQAPCSGTQPPAVAGPSTGERIVPWLTGEIRFHSILDLGCGDGAAVRMLTDASYEAHGIDLDHPGDAKGRIRQGDVLRADYEPGYFDAVMAVDVLQDVPHHRVPQILARIDELSNSYIFLCVPSVELEEEMGVIRDTRWWCDRIADFGWRYRLLREDAEMGRLVILAEKQDSLAARILPLIDEIEASGDAPAESDHPARGLRDDLVTLIADLRDGRREAGYAKLSEVAQSLMGLDLPLAEVNPIFHRIVAAMELQDHATVIGLLERDLLPHV